VERHLNHCRDCTGRVADFRAESGAIRLGLEVLADEADFSGFAQKVMARLTPHKPPFWERVLLQAGEIWRYQRIELAGVAAAALALLFVAPVLWRAQVAADAAPVHLAVRSVRVDPAAHVAPVVMTNDQTGDAIIWLVDHEDHQDVDESSSDEEPTAPHLPQQ